MPHESKGRFHQPARTGAAPRCGREGHPPQGRRRNAQRRDAGGRQAVESKAEQLITKTMSGKTRISAPANSDAKRRRLRAEVLLKHDELQALVGSLVSVRLLDEPRGEDFRPPKPSRLHRLCRQRAL